MFQIAEVGVPRQMLQESPVPIAKLRLRCFVQNPGISNLNYQSFQKPNRYKLIEHAPAVVLRCANAQKSAALIWVGA
jgi:hypothetical protein